MRNLSSLYYRSALRTRERARALKWFTWSRSFAILLLLAGSYWLSRLLPAFVISAWQGKLLGIQGVLIGGFLFPVLAGPGLAGIYSGWRLLRNPSHAAIRRATGLVAIVAVFAIAMGLDGFLPGNPHSTGSLLIATLVVIPLYVGSSKFLMRREGLYVQATGEFVGRGMGIWVALLVWLASFELLVDKNSITTDGSTPSVDGFWMVFTFFGPLILAWIVYYFWMGFVRGREPKIESSGSPPRKADVQQNG